MTQHQNGKNLSKFEITLFLFYLCVSTNRIQVKGLEVTLIFLRWKMLWMTFFKARHFLALHCKMDYKRYSFYCTSYAWLTNDNSDCYHFLRRSIYEIYDTLLHKILSCSLAYSFDLNSRIPNGLSHAVT